MTNQEPLNPLATIEEVQEVKSITGFDRLELLTVAGCDAVATKDTYKVGDLVLFIHQDAVLPETPEFEVYKKYVKGRVKAAKIGNSSTGYVWSQGLVIDLEILDKLNVTSIFQELGMNLKDVKGREISDLLGVTKYEESNSAILNKIKRTGNPLPYDIPKTDETRWTNLRKVPYGELCDITLKVDGTSFTVYYNLEEGKYGVTSRTVDFGTNPPEPYKSVVTNLNIVPRLVNYCREHKVSLALRGEITGQGIQSFAHNPRSKNAGKNAEFFSVYNITEQKYERTNDIHYFSKVCNALQLPTVPILNRDAVLTKELIILYQNIPYKDFNHEGVVINTANISFKVINSEYDSKKK